MEEEREDTVVLTDEDGGEHPFRVLDVIEVNDKLYAVLQPVGDEENEAFIFRVEQDENGEEVLYDIEDDDEWEQVAEAYDTMLWEAAEED
ncbi:MAG: DUF1292 domain-containing protein [Alicyclobacillaceae bacterium]|nr:DUF1292 domain-containing protein [Alicyclobacillaceae bacterium]